jgi:membrane-associated PAP2 superfamily phosphatase
LRFRIPLLILALGVVVGLIFLVAPGLDHRVTDYFYDTATRKFPLAMNVTLVTLRDLNRVIDIGFGVVLGAAILWKLWKPERALLISGRAMLFLTITFVLAPGVMANVIFKEHWSRPRPVHVTEYGGQASYVHWWDPRGTCKANCSFVSGEVSAAAWTLAPAALVPPPWRPVAVGAAVVFTGVIAVVRIGAGGHFLSDALFAALLTALIVWFVHDLIYRRWRGRLTDAALDAQLARWGRTLRGRRPEH